MITGSARMNELQQKTDRSVEKVTIDGADVKRVLLRTGQKFYRSAIQGYLLDKIIARAEQALEVGTPPADAMAASADAVLSEQWIDIGGQMMPRGRIDALCEAVESGRITDLDALNAELDRVLAAYAEDEWAWVRWAYARVYGRELDTVTPADLSAMADELLEVRGKFLNLVLNDAKKEFGPAVQTGFGQDGSTEDVAADFEAVRGRFETNKFVRQMNDEIVALRERVEQVKERLGG